jgi:hypothetical protein
MREPKCRPPAARQGLEDRRDRAQAAIAQLGARHGGARRPALAEIGQVEHRFCAKLRMQADVEQSALAAGIDLGHAGSGVRLEPAVGEDPEPARPLGDQDPAVGQEGDGPGLFQVAAQGHQPVDWPCAAQDFLGARDGGRRGRRAVAAGDLTSAHRLS